MLTENCTDQKNTKSGLPTCVNMYCSAWPKIESTYHQQSFRKIILAEKKWKIWDQMEGIRHKINREKNIVNIFLNDLIKMYNVF